MIIAAWKRRKERGNYREDVDWQQTQGKSPWKEDSDSLQSSVHLWPHQVSWWGGRGFACLCVLEHRDDFFAAVRITVGWLCGSTKYAWLVLRGGIASFYTQEHEKRSPNIRGAFRTRPPKRPGFRPVVHNNRSEKTSSVQSKLVFVGSHNYVTADRKLFCGAGQIQYRTRVQVYLIKMEGCSRPQLAL